MKKWYYLLALPVLLMSCSDDDVSFVGPNCTQETGILLNAKKQWVYTGETMALYVDKNFCERAVKSVSVNGKAVEVKAITADSLTFVFPTIADDSATIAVNFTSFDATLSKKVRVFPGNGTWKEIQSFPGTGRAETRVVVASDKAYVLKGLVYSGQMTPFTDVFRYEPATNSWQKSIDNPLFASSRFETYSQGRLLCQLSTGFSMFDLETGVYKKIMAPPVNPDCIGFEVNGEAYFINDATNHVGIYEILHYGESANQWEKLAQTNYDGPYDFLRSAFSIGGKVYFPMKIINTVEAELISYDLDSKTFAKSARLHVPVTDPSDSYLNYLFTIGQCAYFMDAGEVDLGNNGDIIRVIPTNRLYVYNTAVEEWHITTTEYPAKFVNTTSFAVGGRGFVGLGVVRQSATAVTYPQNFYEFVPQ